MNDPFVKEVREVREKHAKQFGNDLHAICEDIRKYHEKLREATEIDRDNRFVKHANLINH